MGALPSKWLKSLKMMELLLYLTPIGLILDIVGFLMVVLYGHRLFKRSGGLPDNSKGKDGDEWIVEDRSYKGESSESKRLRFKAYLGVGIVVFGFSLQIIGSLAAIHL